MRNARVTVVGSLNMDLVVRVDRLPGPGETVAGSSVEYRHGGKGANQAVAAAALGARVRLIGAVGQDTYGRELTDGLRRHGVPTEELRLADGEPSGVALIVVDAAGQNTITIAPGANATLAPQEVTAALGELADTEIVMLQMEIPNSVNLAVARLARERGVRTVLNAAPLAEHPSVEFDELLTLCDVLVVNEAEAIQLLGHTPQDWIQAAGKLLALGPAAAVITLGANGAVVTDGQQQIFHPGFRVDVVDGTGAGDDFCGALAVALATGVDWRRALAEGCAAGAIACTRLGAQSGAATSAEISALLDHQGYRDAP